MPDIIAQPLLFPFNREVFPANDHPISLFALGGGQSNSEMISLK